MNTIRYFIGTSAKGEDADAEMVYEYSIYNNTKNPVDITYMRYNMHPESPWGQWNTIQWPTPFSGFRWAIAEACGFKGRAIYTDVDMINFRDVKELWNTDLHGKPIAARRGSRFGGHEFCVMVIDCEKIAEHLMPLERMKKIPESHHRYIRYFSGNDALVQELDPRWNCLDGEGRSIDDIWILHFTKMASQPWKPAWFTGTPEEHVRPDLVKLWFDMREEALASGKIKNTPQELFPDDYRIIGR